MVRGFFLLLVPFCLLAKDPKLDLEAFLEAPDPWYPGQVGMVIYKISYQGKIQLLEEELPLLNLEGFEKVGDKTFSEYVEKGLSVQEIRQKYRALEAKNVITKPSVIRGGKTLFTKGKLRVLPPLLTASVPPFSLEVTPLPEQGMPPYFTNSVGKFSFSLEQTPPETLRLGDWFSLPIHFTKENPLDPLYPPELECTPGFAAFFSVDTPSQDDNMWVFRLSPKTTLLSSIPKLRWSFFDPKTNTYATWTSPSFPLKVLPKSAPTSPFSTQQTQPVPPAFPQVSLPKITDAFLPDWIHTYFWQGVLLLFLFFPLYVYLQKQGSALLEAWKSDPKRRLNHALRKTKDPKEKVKLWQEFLQQATPSPERTHLLELCTVFRFSQETTLSLQKIEKECRRLLQLLFVCFLFPQTLSATLLDEEATWNRQLQTELQKEKQDTLSLATTSWLLATLEQKPLALAYLELALRKDPNNPELKERLATLQNELGLQNQRPPFPLSLELLEALTLGVLVLTLVFWRQNVLRLAGSCLLFFLLSSCWILGMLHSRELITLHPSYLYSSPSKEQKVQPLPLLPGEKLLVLQGKDGWLFVKTAQGELGYIEESIVFPLLS